MKRKSLISKVLIMVMALSMMMVGNVEAFAEKSLRADETTAYTVDFSYNGVTMQIAGGSQNFDLEEIFSGLGIRETIDGIEIFAEAEKICFEGNIVTNSNGEVIFDIAKNGDSWLLNSYKAFDEKFILIASSENESYEIQITDPKTDSFQDPSKDNNYTCIYEGAEGEIEYQWMRSDSFVEIKNAEGMYYLEKGTRNDNAINAVESGEFHSILLEPKKGNTLIKFKYSGGESNISGCEFIIKDGDNYLVEISREKNLCIDSDDGEFSITDVQICKFVAVSTKSDSGKLPNSVEIGDYYYHCDVYEGGIFNFSSALVKPVEISFVGGAGSTGSIPSVYQLEGRTVDLPTSGVEKNGCVLCGWDTNNPPVSALADYEAGSENATLYAVWETQHVHDGFKYQQFPSRDGKLATNSNILEETKIVSGASEYTVRGIKQGGTYYFYLHENVYLDDNLIIPTGTNVTICLNGYAITPDIKETGTRSYPAIENKGNLTIRDCGDYNNDNTHYFIKNDDNWAITTDTSLASLTSFNGGVVACSYAGTSAIDNQGTLELKSGNISFNNGSAISTSGSFEMTGGEISNNNSPFFGAGVCVNGGIATMTNGSINNCTSNNGGGLSVRGGSFTMTGGNIRNNTGQNTNPDSDDSGCGGGVYLDGGTFTMTGGVISNNDAFYLGGGVYISGGMFSMSGNAKINKNKAKNDDGGAGGGVCIDGGLFEMVKTQSGTPEITDNYANGDGGGIQINACSATNIRGGLLASNTSQQSGGGIFISDAGCCQLQDVTITNNKAGASGAGVCFGGEKSSCLIEGTKITMADGSTKAVENIKVGDMVRTFDHDTGKVSSEKICLRYESEDEKEAFTLHFSNDIDLGVVGAHGFLVKEAGKYVNITESNAKKFIGKHFYNADSKQWEELKSVTKSNKKYKYYSLYSAHHMNCVANHMISVTDDVIFRLNIFEMDENLKYDAVKKQADIDKYGLFTYEDIKDYVDEEDFDNFNDQYNRIAVLKGLITAEELIGLGTATEELKEEDSNKAALMSAGEKMPLSTRNISTLAGTNEEIESLDPGTLLIGSNVTIKNNKVGDNVNNLYLADEKTVTIASDTNNLDVGVSTQSTPTTSPTNINVVLTGDNDKDYSKYFTSDKIGYTVKQIGKHLELIKGYKVTYDKNGGSGDEPVDEDAHQQLEDVTIATAGNLSKTGYELSYWNTKPDNKGKQYDLNSIINNTKDDVEDLNLYAIWTPIIKTQPSKTNNYKISTDAEDVSYQWYKQGSTKTAVQESDIKMDDSVFEATESNILCSKPAYPSGNGLILTFVKSSVEENGALLQFDCDKQLAGYLSKDGNTYTFEIKYYSKGGYRCFLSNPDAAFTITNVYFRKKSEAIPMETSAQLSTSNEDAEYYCEISNSSYNTSAKSDAVKTNAISFVGGDGATGDAPETMYQLEGRKITLPANSFSKDGCVFDKWTDGSKSYAAGTEYTVGSDNVTLTATWKAASEPTPPTTSATIEFDSNGGEGAMSSKTIVQGSELTLPECTMTAPFGQQFAGWKVGDKTYAAGDKITVMSSMKIQAIWVDIPEAPYVVAKASALGKKALKLSWTECKGAAEYVIYANKCNAKGKQYKMKKIATTARSSYKLAKLSGKALKANTFYKIYIAALDENGEEIARSAVMHAATGNYKGKLGNPVKIVAKDAEMELLVGDSGNADVKALKIYKDKKLPESHATGFRYMSSNPNIATVDSEGVVTGVKAGACKIYIQAANGLWAEIELTVKNR